MRRVPMKKKTDSKKPLAKEMATFKKHTKGMKQLEKEIIQFLNEASTKGRTSTRPG